MPDLAETTCWLVDIPSVTGEEAAIRDAISARLGSRSRSIVRESLVVGAPEPGKLLLVGHLDTVPLQGPAGSRMDGGRIFGLGSTDMKGGLAVMIHLLEELGDDHLVGIFYAGEEGPFSGNQLAGVLDALPALTEAEAAIVLEPTDREIHAGCQGVVNARVWFEGEAAHSARPWLGVNAVTRAGQFLTMMDGVQPEPRMVEGLEFREVISVTGAAGGVATNIIPPLFELTLNYRFAPDRTVEEATERLRRLGESADGFEVVDTAPAAYPEISHPLFTTLAAASGARVGHKQGWTDVAQLAQRGVPAVNFGPGEAGLAHRPEESVRLDDLTWAYSGIRDALSRHR